MTIDALEAKQAELLGREAKLYLTRLIESSPDAIMSTDKDGNVVLFSESAETLLGYRAKEVTGRRSRYSTVMKQGQDKSRWSCASVEGPFLP